MDVIALELPGVRLFKTRAFSDERGVFRETFRAEWFADAGLVSPFVQDNRVVNGPAGVVRGLHMQGPPSAQDKLVAVTRGGVLDVAVDARKSSPNYGEHLTHRLDGDSGEALLIPAGFLHGYVTLEPGTEVVYKVSAYHDPQTEVGVRWDDPDLGVDWGVAGVDVKVSAKDAAAPLWRDFLSPFA